MPKAPPAPTAHKPDLCTSVFKKGTLTKEDYTSIWITLISAFERERNGRIPPSR